MKNDSKTKWIVSMFLITFILSLVFSGTSSMMVQKMNTYIAVFVLLLIIVIGVAFDIIGMAIATASESPFHARAAKKQKGAKETIRLLKNKDKATNFCNDLMGDICGIISGSVSALIAVKFANMINIDITIATLIIGALVASITVGGKAIGKNIGITHSESIMAFVGKVIHLFYRVK